MQRAWILLAACFLLLACLVSAATISQVKSSPALMKVTVEGVITYLESGECYLESLDRLGGIWVLAPTEGLSVGDRVTATGNFALIMGEPVIKDAFIHPLGSQAEIRPFAMPNRSLGGAPSFSSLWIYDYQPQSALPWIAASGLCNVGLLVTTWGTVKAIHETPTTGAKWLVIDDGSQTIGDNGDIGVSVYTDAEVEMGDRISVTGVSSTDGSLNDSNRLVRAIRTRDASDVQVIAHRDAPVYPFSDEFNNPTLDPRWAVVPSNASISTATEPGWAKISRNNSYYMPLLAQKAPGDWQMDVKIRIPSSTNTYVYASLDLQFWPSEWNTTYMCAFQQLDTNYCIVFPPNTITEVPGDTCYFRVVRQGEICYCSASSDGINYIEASAGYEASGDLLVITGYMSPDPECIFYIDYIRFSPIGSQGGLQ